MGSSVTGFHVLVADLGGSSLRVALLAEDGSFTAVAPFSDPMGSGIESDPQAWWIGFCRAAQALFEQAPRAFASVQAIAITGATRTMVCLDQAGCILGPASTFRDTRASIFVGEILPRLPAAHPETAFINAFHPVARLYRMRQQECFDFSKLAYVVDPKDFLNFKLTGVMASDPISSWRLAAAYCQGGEHPSLLAALGLPSSLLPPLLHPTDVVGDVRKQLDGALSHLAGKPVLAMSHDTWSSALGLGALQSGRAYNLSGTTEVFGVLSERAGTADGLLSMSWNDGLHQLGGPSLAGGDTLNWVLDMVGRGETPIAKALDDLLSLSDVPKGLIVLPHLQGERVPFWDPDLRGAVLGLSRSHGSKDLVRATLEGVAYLNRLVLSRAEAALGLKVDAVRFGGGGAASSHWAQIKADIMARSVCVAASNEPGLTGCALAAFVAIGVAPDLCFAQDKFVSLARRYEPRQDMTLRYDRLYALFEQAEAALMPLSKALAGL